MRRLTALTALTAALSLTMGAVALPAMAQTPAPAAQPAQPAPDRGVVPAEVKTWLTGLGGNASDPVAADGGFVIHVADQPLPWSINMFGCSTRCDDIQYNAVFTGPITEAQVTNWNKENRYLKAIWIAPTTPGGDATVLAQYDVLLLSDGSAQLQEPSYVWLQLLTRFARALFASVAPAGATPPPSGQ